MFWFCVGVNTLAFGPLGAIVIPAFLYTFYLAGKGEL